MSERLSKLAKIIIILNIVFAILVVSFQMYRLQKLNETEELISEVMIESRVGRELAIEILVEDGIELSLGGEFTAYASLVFSFFSVVLLYSYYRSKSFILGFFTAVACVFTSFLGGLLLFYVILSGKGTIKGSGTPIVQKDEWESFIHRKND